MPLAEALLLCIDWLSERAVDAPIVRRLFTSSPRDPRYHMLSYLSNKFVQVPTNSTHEPRAALFLNRFTRTLAIMFATDGVEEILGVSPRQLVSKSFYFCIQEQCLHDAVRCLESAKINNSIAYLRFWYRNPLEDNNSTVNANTAAPSDNNLQNNPYNNHTGNSSSRTDFGHTTTSSNGPALQQHAEAPFELEAVVSCTSDGLVVVLRRARPMIPMHQPQPSHVPITANGIFATPWVTQPIYPQYQPQPMATHTPCVPPTYPGTTFSEYNPTYGTAPGYPAVYPGHPGYNNYGPGGPHPHDFLSTIREVAVFAWGIIGINGSLERYRKGQPRGDALPPDGIAVWNSQSEDEEIVSDDQIKETSLKMKVEHPDTIQQHEGVSQ